MRIVVTLALCLQLLAPVAAWAQSKDPLSYPLKQYGFLLGTALLGGLVSWYAKLRNGEVPPWSINHLIGELATSAFAGLLCFWACEAFNVPQLITACLVGIAGHMGTRALALIEEMAVKRAQRLAAKE